MEATLSSISLKSKPAKTTYYVGDTLDTTGLTLTATYSDGHTENVSSEFSCSPMTLHTAGTQAITIRYYNKTTTFTVTVTEPTVTSIVVRTKPTKTSYYVGDTLNTAGLTLTATYNTGKTETISSGFTCSPTTLNTAGTQRITVTYGQQTTTFDVDVIPFVEPTKLEWYINGSLITNTTAGATIRPGKTLQFSAEIVPENATNKTITWASSNPAVAKIDNTGLVTGLSFGTTTISATTVNGIQRTLEVKVVDIEVAMTLDVISLTDTFDGKCYGVDYDWSERCYHPGSDIVVKYKLNLQNQSQYRTGIDEVVIDLGDTGMLPEKIEGQYWLQDIDSDGNHSDLLGIEGINGSWQIKSNRCASVLDEYGQIIKTAKLELSSFYKLQIEGYRGTAIVFTEPVTTDRNEYIKLRVKANTILSIGRTKSNAFVYNNRFVSSNHAKLEYDGRRWKISDCDSTNGTFVNGYSVAQGQKLNMGDVIFIMGFKIIIGTDFIACNNPDGKMSILSNDVFPFEMPILEKTDADEDAGELEEKDFFYRSPRFKRDIKKLELSIDAPPSNQIGEEMPMILLIGPSITMGMASMATGVFAITNAIENGNVTSALPSIVMAFSMLLGTVLWPIISKRYEKKRRRKKEALRQEKYIAYLDELNNTILQNGAEQAEILRENHITLADCISRIEHVQRNLWERSPGQNDFLLLRVGLGELPLVCEIKFPEKRFTLENDNLEDKLYALCQTPHMLDNVPITISLFHNYISGVIGSRKEATAFAKGLLLQIAALYSYDEVKLVLIYDETEFDFAKWFPHTWDSEHSFHFIATNSAEVKEVSSYLERVVSERSTLDEQHIHACTPYYVVFALSRTLALKTDVLQQIYNQGRNLNISVVSFFNELKNLPKECSIVVELTESTGGIFDKNDISGKSITFQNDVAVRFEPRNLSVKLANTVLDQNAGAFALPKMLTFLDMFNVGKVEHLNALTRWRENDPTKSLQTAVGVNTFGDIFYLDLHEKYHGPHGLVAGMTGSGKSEFIITYILSLAVNYHPNEVAFILIDYKGGGMAKSFEQLPHVAGIITNLDGAAIKRSLVSIESELKHRQSVFASASKKLGISNIDIYKYQKAFRDGQVDEPLPHLFIISDEFAELKTQQPEFMMQLVSAARIGRSLGVHLILATQKPSGVVDDQIWSNSKFRVCLKVQDTSDSMDMLKRADAAALKDTGRFYLQVGYNELFELGQSAWAGAPYYPSDRVSPAAEKEVSIIDGNGHTIQTAKFDRKSAAVKDPQKQLDVITKYLARIAANENIKVKPLWKAPIEPIIYVQNLRKKYRKEEVPNYFLNPVVGEYDIPSRQTKDILTVPLSTEGNVIVYGFTGSGKTTFISTMLMDLLTTHTAETVNAYVLDFGAETMRAFEKAPHVGDVIYAPEAEKIANLFKMLKSEIQNRKKKFADFGGDYTAFCKTSGSIVPNIILFINNYSAFSELYEAYEEYVSFLSREGTKYGIYTVITATSPNAVRYKLLQNFKQFFVLQLNDEMDYSSVLGNTGGIYPSRIKGRGIIKRDEVYEFQTAYFTEPEKSFEQIREKCNELMNHAGQCCAKAVPILPEKVDVAFLSNAQNSLHKTPIGVNKSTLEIASIDLTSSLVTIVSALDIGSMETFAQGIAEIVSQNENVRTVVFDFDGLFHRTGFESYEYYSDIAEDSVVDLFNLMVHRYNSYKSDRTLQFEPIVYIIPSLAGLYRQLSADGADKLNVLLEKGEPVYGISVIVCDAITEVQQHSMRAWYKRHCSKGDGIWIGDGVTDQYQLKISRASNELYREMEPGFGIIISSGKYQIVKLVQPEYMETEVDVYG